MTYAEIKNKAINVIAAAFSGVFLYQAAFGVWEAHVSRGLYILFTLVLTFLIYPLIKNKVNKITEIIDLGLVLLSCLVVTFYIFKFDFYADMAGLKLQPIDIYMGVITVILVLEAARRLVGWALPIIGIVFLFYTIYGRSLPDIISHKGYDLNRVISVLYASTDGIFGSVVYVFSTFIFLFIIFGTFLQRSGAGLFFIELSKAFVGKFTGGPAQAAVVSSWILGSVIGSSTANTAITGAVTIPLMISRGYKRHVAAAIEAVVSIGGQFMPPIMGAAAFLMAAFVGVPYVEIIKAGFIPAILFFLSMIFMVYLEAKRMGLKGMPAEELPNPREVLKSGWHSLVPIVVIIVFLIRGNSPSMVAFWAIVTAFLVSLVRKETRMSVRDVFETLAEGAKSSLIMAVTAGVVGIIITAIALPGLGMKFSLVVLKLSGGSLPIALALVMVASFVLGMGMNVTSAYLVLITLAAPALVEMGIPLLTAHFFVFWASQLAVITPPVCISAYVAAAIAQADAWKTGWYSLRMGLSIYYIPIMFVYIPYLLWQGTFIQIIGAAITALLGVLSFSAAMQGFLIVKTTLIDRALLTISSILLVLYGTTTDILGLAALIAVAFLQHLRLKKGKLSDELSIS
ncbi:MAG: TRAP transporter permease [Bacillota bacterium]